MEESQRIENELRIIKKKKCSCTGELGCMLCGINYNDL